MQHQLHTKILSLATPLAQELNLDIWGLEIIGSSRLMLRLFVESAGNTAKPESAENESPQPARSTSDIHADEPMDDQAQDYAPVGEQGVNIDECAQLSRTLGFILDTDDFIPDAYTLEVSSPGLERIFFNAEQILPYVGQRLDLTLNKVRPEYPGRKSFVGIIQPSAQGQDKDSFTFLPDDGPEPGVSPISLIVPWSEVKKNHLVYDFDAGKGKKRSQKD